MMIRCAQFAFVICIALATTSAVAFSADGNTPSPINEGSFGAAIRTKVPTNIYSPGDPIEFVYTMTPDMVLPVWIGLMKASEPRRNLPFSDPSININPFQPKTVDIRATGVFTYTAPDAAGEYEVRMFEKVGGDEYASFRFRVEDRFIQELRAWQNELKDARALFNRRFGRDNINATYVEAFRIARVRGGNERALDLSNSFYVRFVTNDATTPTFAFYNDPIEKVQGSIFQITGLLRSPSKDDVQHYRQGIRRWRETHLRLHPMLDRYIAIEAEAARDSIETNAKLTRLNGNAKDAEQKAFSKRIAERDKRKLDVRLEISSLMKPPIFDYLATRGRPSR